MTTDRDAFLLELADKYCRQSYALSIAAQRNGAVGELQKLRESVAKAVTICRRFPGWATLMILKELDGK